ncbi:Protein kinase superfamily protein [Euphorbia peplus]|nr:Protein kinase superfamily protein [Euphorbia peplus]
MGNICGSRDLGTQRLELTRTPQLAEQVVVAPPLRQEIQIQDGGSFHEYSFTELADATESFTYDNLIGEGAFGQVYKAVVRNEEVAIKRLNNKVSAQQEATFMNEMDALLTINHENLVKLIGYCNENSNRIIVCEYCSNLSLRLHLHGHGEHPTSVEKTIAIPTLSWETRMHIAIGSAKGLQYLHDVCEAKIIHRDIKPDNIVLDANYKAKIVDFGLAKFFPESGSITHLSSQIKGTQFYADKEHDPNQKVSDKSDVYSLGVVLLELFSARKPDADGVSILEWAKPLIKNVVRDENKIKALIDPKLITMYNENELRSYKMEMKVVLFCAAASVYKPSKDRPKMIQIVNALEAKILPNEIWNNRDSVFLKPTPNHI